MGGGRIVMRPYEYGKDGTTLVGAYSISARACVTGHKKRDAEASLFHDPI